MNDERQRDLLSEINAWFISQCDGNWEHSYGVRLDTMDNPGWILRVGLEETELESLSFETISSNLEEMERPYWEFVPIGDAPWFLCEVKEREFVGMGDPTSLHVILKTFLDFAHSAPKTDSNT